MGLVGCALDEPLDLLAAGALAFFLDLRKRRLAGVELGKIGLDRLRVGLRLRFGPAAGVKRQRTRACRDDRCVRRCADQLTPCQNQCAQEPAARSKPAKKGNDVPPPPRTNGWGKSR